MPILDQFSRPFPTQEQREEASGFRIDNWQNGLTGIGTSADKLNGQGHGRFFPTWRVLDQELTNLHNGSDLAKHVVDRRPKEMFRRGYDIESDGLTASQTEAMREYATDVLDLDTNLREAVRWGRLYGGCLLVLNIDDGGFPWEPLDVENIKSFNSCSLVDRRYAYVQSQYSSMNGSHYGRPEIYLISNAVAVSGWNSHSALRKKPGWELMKEGGQVTLVHESRTIRFDGNDADIVTRQQLAGWSWSVLQVIYDAMRQFEHAFDSVGYLLSDASQGVFKIQNLVKTITTGQRNAFAARMQVMEMTRSVLRGIAVDAGDKNGNNAEDFTRVATPFGSIPELLDRMMLRFAAAAEEPATILFGRAPGGLNASGDNELRAWYDTIATEQENELTPRLKRIYRLIALAAKGPVKGKDVRFKIHHKPLWSPTDAEKATTTLAISQRDIAYIGAGVVTPEEVAVDLGDIYPNLDIKAREQVIKTKESFDPYNGDPKPGAPGGPPLAPGAMPHPDVLKQRAAAQKKAGIMPTPFGVGPVDPRGAANVNGAAGEPIGGPQVPMPLLGGGSIGGASPAKGKPPAALGAPGNLRPKQGAVSPEQGEAFREHGSTRDDFDPDQPREPNGEFGSGGGGSAAPTKGTLASLADHVKSFFSNREARSQVISHAIGALKSAPGKLGKAAIDHVKHEVHEAKSAFTGIRAVLSGGSMTHEQSEATKKIAIKVASRIAASAIMAAFPIGAAAGALTERLAEHVGKKVAEKVAEHISHHIAEHASEKVLHHLFGLSHDSAQDAEGWLAEAMEKAVAAELAKLTPEDLASLGASFKGDAFDPKQPRGSAGRLTSHKATSMGADAYEAGDAAHASGDAEGHLEAAAAHGHAATEFRLLAARHSRMRNRSASARHEASAREHEAQGTEHTMAAGRLAAASAEAGPTWNPTSVPGSQDARATPPALRGDGNAAVIAVWHQLEPDYPEAAIAWVPHYNWQGPQDVDLDEVDFSQENTWAASREPESIVWHCARIVEGTQKPCILVKVKGEKLFHIADGHHRSLAYKFLRRPIRAYTVLVPKTEDGWQPMHDAQGTGSKQKSNQKASQQKHFTKEQLARGLGDKEPFESGDGTFVFDAERFERRYPKGARWDSVNSRWVRSDEWDETKVSRAANGQFGEGGEGTSSAPKDPDEEPRAPGELGREHFRQFDSSVSGWDPVDVVSGLHHPGMAAWLSETKNQPDFHLSRTFPGAGTGEAAGLYNRDNKTAPGPGRGRGQIFVDPEMDRISETELATSRPGWGNASTTVADAAHSGRGEQIQAAFAHELGHHVHMGPSSGGTGGHIDKIVQDAWAEHLRNYNPEHRVAALRGDAPATAVSRYAEHDPHEYFAETFGAYMREADRTKDWQRGSQYESLKEHDPVGYKMVKDVLRAHGIE